MITHTLWVYMPLLDPHDLDGQAKRDHEVMQAIEKVSPGSGMDFESGERSLSFEYGERRTGTIGRAVAAVLKLPYVTRVSVTRV